MTTNKSAWADALIHLYTLASRLEGEGQYNLAKLVRAAADSLCRRETHPLDIPTDKDKLTADVLQTIETLSRLNVSSDLIATLKQGADFMAQGKLSPISATPHSYVCRTCGYVTLSLPEESCPVCGAWVETFQKFMPNYWFEALEPPAALNRLRQTPLDVEKIIEGLSDETMNRTPPDGGWAIRNALSHLRDAQSVLNFRLDLFQKEEYPDLEAKAVFEWATNKAGNSASSMEIYETYLDSRKETLNILEKLHPSEWGRKGRHEEFGWITIKQQVSYFALHEITHLPQIEMLRDQIKNSQ